jgi:DNA-binding MarR family transcriptional regulator
MKAIIEKNKLQKQAKLSNKTTLNDALQSDQPDDALIDLETRLTDDHHQSLKLWLRLLSCTVMVEDQIRARLRSEFAITLPRFDLMAQLERYPEGLRMGELSRRMMVTGANVTGITDQLEQEQLVVRMTDPKDRRAYSVKLTPEGKRTFKRMATVHGQWIEEIFSSLAIDQKNQMIEILSQVKSHLKSYR